jgi:hypothetical protein
MKLGEVYVSKYDSIMLMKKKHDDDDDDYDHDNDDDYDDIHPKVHFPNANKSS